MARSSQRIDDLVMNRGFLISTYKTRIENRFPLQSVRLPQRVQYKRGLRLVDLTYHYTSMGLLQPKEVSKPKFNVPHTQRVFQERSAV